MKNIIISILRFNSVYEIFFVKRYKYGLKIKRSLQIKGIGRIYSIFQSGFSHPFALGAGAIVFKMIDHFIKFLQSFRCRLFAFGLANSIVEFRNTQSRLVKEERSAYMTQNLT